ncbi:MAG TPA: hypothetical protein VFO19_19095, partial [Vicinamibacterales bacterium]|nr:hypothetical protein [Vicinamibacterales bacterium]
MLGAQPYGRQASRAEELLQAALTKAVVEGKGAEAIPLFEEALRTPGVTARVTAKALLHLGGIYTSLCRPEARDTYERLVREFSGQPESGEASKKLAALPACIGRMVQRTLWT